MVSLSVIMTEQEGWRYCLRCRALVYTGLQPTADCANGTQHDFSKSGTYLVTRDSPLAFGQANWRWCRKCQQMIDPTKPQPSFAIGSHDLSQSANYQILNNVGAADGQHGWKVCNKCGTLAYDGDGAPPGACSASGFHDHSGSSDFILPLNQSRSFGQNGWRWCSLCQALINSDNAFLFPSGGHKGSGGGPQKVGKFCPGGIRHNTASSGYYTLIHDLTGARGQKNWRWCGRCYSLVYGETSGSGPCNYGGVHDLSKGYNYVLDWTPGAPGQNQWQYCHHCYSLTYTGNPTKGACFAGGVHDTTGSSDYTLVNYV